MFGKLNGKVAVWLATLVLLSIFLLLSTTWDLRSSFTTQMVYLRSTFQGSRSPDAPAYRPSSFRECGILNVYMYDMPRKFNLGMIKRGPHQNLPWPRNQKLPNWPSKSGLKRQHSVEYWMMLYLLGDQEGNGQERSAVRVENPEEADVFFVPFFSSLSFNNHGVNMLDPESEKDHMLQVEVVNFLQASPWWQRSGGRDHVLVMHHPNALRFVREQLNASIFVLADFGRFTQKLAWLGKDVVAPYAHVIGTYNNDDSMDPFQARTTLLYFRGRIRRKDDGIVRVKLAKLLQNHPSVIFEESSATNEGVEMAMNGMRSSRFCLHPAGDTPSSCRLFDAIVSRCVPVIISDKIELPFEDEINYEEFCVFFSVQEALTPGLMLNALDTFPKHRWLEMWKKLKLVSHHFEYQHPPKKDDAVNMIWKQVQRKLPSVNLAVHRSKRLKIPDWWHW